MAAHYILIVWLAFWADHLQFVHCVQTSLPIRRITGKFVFPFQQSNGRDKCDQKSFSKFRSNTQQVAVRATELECHHRGDQHTTKYSVIYQVMYITDISIGTPPQPFRAIIDITQSNLFVPSINCTDRTQEWEVENCLYHLMYDSVASSTYQLNLTPARLHYYGVYTWGNLSQDTIHIGDISVEKHIFQEATMWHPAYLIDWDEQYDSVLGLARLRTRSAYDNFNVSNPLENMVQQNTLDRNVFAIRHPRTDADEGQLILGGVDDSITRSVVRLDLVDGPFNGDDSNFIEYASAGWVVAASSLTLGAYLDQDPLMIPLPNYLAVLTNGYGNMMLPQRMAKQIAEYLQWDDWLDDFPCEQRDRFPNLTISLGPQQQAFVLSPWQYMPEVTDLEGHQKCLLPFIPLYQDGTHPDYILLGGSFLASFYTEFDLDQKTIGLANYTRL